MILTWGHHVSRYLHQISETTRDYRLWFHKVRAITYAMNKGKSQERQFSSIHTNRYLTAYGRKYLGTREKPRKEKYQSFGSLIVFY